MAVRDFNGLNHLSMTICEEQPWQLTVVCPSPSNLSSGADCETEDNWGHQFFF